MTRRMFGYYTCISKQEIPIVWQNCFGILRFRDSWKNYVYSWLPIIYTYLYNRITILSNLSNKQMQLERQIPNGVSILATKNHFATLEQI